MRDRQLFVQGVDTDGSKPGSSAEVAAKHGLNGFALVKLESFGFHQSRCIQSLKDNEGDVGRALEKLMSDCFDLGLDEEPSDIEEDLKEMYREQKEDEKMALESIYGEGFAERVPGKVWEIKLALPGMDKFCEEAKVPTRKKTKNEMGKDVCRFVDQRISNAEKMPSH